MRTWVFTSGRTGRGSEPERPATAARAVAVEVAGFVGVDPLAVHLVRLSGFLQLGQNQTPATLGRSVHLEHLKGRGDGESGKGRG